RPGRPSLRLRLDDELLTVQIERLPGRALRLTHRGVIRRAQILPPRAAELAALMPEKAAADSSRLVQSPMPGLLTAVVVAEGQEVKAGEPLVVVEAMKMENVLRAERDGKVARLRAKPGDSLAVDQVILEYEGRCRRCGCASRDACRASVTAPGRCRWRRGSGCAAGCATGRTPVSRRSSSARTTRSNA